MKKRQARQCPPLPAACPWLLFYHGRGFRNQTFHTISQPPSSQNNNSGSSSSVRSVPELRNKTVWNSCHGWLILSDNDEDQFSLFNPVTLECILLPPYDKLDPKTNISDCALSSPPTDPSCTLFLFDGGLCRILFCRLENKHWSEKRYVKEIEAINKRKSDKDYLKLPVFCRGKLYASTNWQLASIDTVEQDTSNLLIKPLGTEMPSDYEQLAPCLTRFLVESDGYIYCIIVMRGGRMFTDVFGIEIFILDLTSVTWERVESVKDRVFFLCSNYAISCPAVCTEQVGGTCVYFTRREDKSLYAYNIKDDSVSVSLPCPNLSTPWKSPIWVMPNLRLTNDDCRKAVHISEKNQQKQEEEGSGEEKKELVEKGEHEKIEAKEGLNLLDLPSDILKSICKLLMPVDYMKFRAVSTMTRQLAPHIEWRTSMSGLDQRRYSLSSPWLLNFEKNCGVLSFVDPYHNDKYLVRIPTSLENVTLCYCKDGWLLMCQWSKTTDPEDPYQSRLIFFNPFTKETIIYPPFRFLMLDFSQFGFSSSPSSSNCVVVVVSCIITTVSIYISRSREEEWSHFQLESNSNFGLGFMSYPVFANGAFYIMSKNGGLGVLKLEGTDENNGCSLEILENTKSPCKSFSRNFLVECDGELLSVFVADFGKWVEVFKLNNITLVWERVHSLGNRTLYISHSSALSTKAKAPEMEEKIYLPRFCEQGIVSYSLATGLYHYSSRCEEGLYHYSSRGIQLSVSSIQTSDERQEPKKKFKKVKTKSDRRRPQPSVRPSNLRRDVLTSYNYYELRIRIGFRLKDIFIYELRRRLTNDNHRKAVHISGKEEQKKEEEQGSGKDWKEVVEKEEHEKIVAKERLNLLDLPLDVLKSICGLLMPVYYMKFRAVSTVTRRLAPHIEWRTSMSGLDQRHYSLSSPWLLNFEKKLRCLQFCRPISRRQETIIYPPFPSLCLDFSQFGFSSSPSSSNCVVVVVTWLSATVHIRISRSREEEWSYFELESNSNIRIGFMSYPIFAHGAFYFMGKNGGLGVLKLEGSDDNDGSSWEILENTRSPCKSFSHNFLVECDGELLSVFVPDFGKCVEVFKLNSITLVWERVHSLGNHTLYISNSSALSTKAKAPEMEEKICLPRFCEQGIVPYSLATGLYHYSSGREEGSLKDYYGTRQQLFSGWIVPRWL
ncbi:hypothetical protein Vadar_034067 [Vaccinium darrowii]|uniref:Uncharacterized protein n=1 Tax=Vaccinium darrowii TaxID=229202 RepID=A0ACB7Z7Z8_9ERIC|nr:hypothetical protein Vadar_034067 [Vaccinium darrowii]